MCHQESRLIVRTLPYNFHVVYVPGKQIQMVNALSRNLKFTSKNREEMVEEGQIPFTNSCSQLHYWKLPTASRQTCNGLDQGVNFQRCHITIADTVHQIWLAKRLKEMSKGIAPLLELLR